DPAGMGKGGPSMTNTALTIVPLPVRAKALRSYGFMVETKRDSFSTVSITASVMAREPGKEHPINCANDGERDYDAPKIVQGLYLQGLRIRAFRSSARQGDLYEVYSPSVDYECLYGIDSQSAPKIAYTP